MLVMILSVLLISCKTAEQQSDVKSIEIPVLDVSVDKPVLTAIPSLDTSYMSEEQKMALSSVLAAYNQNLASLASYANELLAMQDIIIDYYISIIKAVQ